MQAPAGAVVGGESAPLAEDAGRRDARTHALTQPAHPLPQVALTSADEGVAVPGSETSVVANADGSSDESSQLSLSETHSTIYWHGYR